MRTFYLFILLVALVTPMHLQAQKTDSFSMDKRFSIQSNGTIHLSSDDAEVTITGSDRQEVRVKVDYQLKVRGIGTGISEPFEMLVEQQGGDLYIKEKPRDLDFKGFTVSQTEDYTILIETPRSANLSVHGDDDSYRISGVDGSIAIDADDASILLSESSSESFDIEIDDGELKRDRGTGRLDLKMDDGNALIAQAMFEVMDISMDDGNLELERANGELNLDVDDGDVTIGDGSLHTIQLKADDSTVELSNRYTRNGSYRFDTDDADLKLTFLDQYGAEIDISHDHADFNIGERFQVIKKDERHSIFQLFDGTASVRINTDDGDITLR